MQDSLLLYSQMIVRLAQSLHQHSNQMTPEQIQGISAIYDRSRRIAGTLARIETVSADEARAFKHDVRNMMTPVLGYTQLLASDRLGQIDAAMQTDCQVILRCIRELHNALDEWYHALHQSAPA
jgi:signal transduction histidine kinase